MLQRNQLDRSNRQGGYGEFHQIRPESLTIYGIEFANKEERKAAYRYIRAHVVDRESSIEALRCNRIHRREEFKIATANKGYLTLSEIEEVLKKIRTDEIFECIERWSSAAIMSDCTNGGDVI